jgi:hypothetical protein
MSRKLNLTIKFMIHNLEAFIWLAVIIYFAVSPIHNAGHFTICPLSLAGFQHCPGCGLGRSIVLLLHARVSESIAMHPLGIFALTIFTGRIFVVFRNYFRFQKQLLPITNQ